MSEPMSNVSVVIPSYNYGRFVAEAVESALAQTYRSVEVIVVDDGSTDDTRERLRPYMDRIRYVYQENRGLSAARNTGIRNAQGEWVAFLDADDLWHPEKLQVQARAAQCNPDVSLLGSPSAERMWPDLSSCGEVIDLVRVRGFLSRHGLGPSGVMVRRTCFDAVGLFDESLRSCEDRDMWLRVATKFQCARVNVPCWWYRCHEDQMSRKAKRMLDNYRAVLGKFFPAHPEYCGLRALAYSYMYLDAAHCYYDEGRRDLALCSLARSCWLRPWGFGDSGSKGRLPRAKLLLKFVAGERAFGALKWVLLAGGLLSKRNAGIAHLSPEPFE